MSERCAAEVTHRSPNIEAAARFGFQALRFTDAPTLRADLVALGLLEGQPSG